MFNPFLKTILSLRCFRKDLVIQQHLKIPIHHHLTIFYSKFVLSFCQLIYFQFPRIHLICRLYYRLPDYPTYLQDHLSHLSAYYSIYSLKLQEFNNFLYFVTIYFCLYFCLHQTNLHPSIQIYHPILVPNSFYQILLVSLASLNQAEFIIKKVDLMQILYFDSFFFLLLIFLKMSFFMEQVY